MSQCWTVRLPTWSGDEHGGGPLRDRRVWYLVLQVGLPADAREPFRNQRGRLVSKYGLAAAQHLHTVSSECKAAGITIRRLSVSHGHNNEHGHYLFRFRWYRRDDQTAVRLTESFAFGLSMVGGLFVGKGDPLVLRVPDVIVRGEERINARDLVALERDRWPAEGSLFNPAKALAAISCTTADVHETAWRIATTSLGNPALFDAMRFIQRSHENFYVAPGGISGVISDPDIHPVSGTLQSNFEDALQNAFKAVEAVIGDPPRDDRRFFEKLREIGIDPHEEVGYTERSPIERVIRQMNAARDKRSAHGSTRNRNISPAELLSFQACAEEVVLAALEKARGCPITP